MAEKDSKEPRIGKRFDIYKELSWYEQQYYKIKRTRKGVHRQTWHLEHSK